MSTVTFGRDGRGITRHNVDPAGAAGTVTMLAGFLDCEELVASMLERLADEAEQKAAGLVLQRDHHVRAIVLREAALAVRLGQHRREVES